VIIVFIPVLALSHKAKQKDLSDERVFDGVSQLYNPHNSHHPPLPPPAGPLRAVASTGLMCFYTGVPILMLIYSNAKF
jgi:hypothetical protein